MDRTAAGLAPRNRTLRRRVGRRARALLGVTFIAALLFVASEVGIRHVPPDGMRVTYTTSVLVHLPDGSFSPRFTYTTYIYSLPKDQQAISATYASLNDGPAYNSLFDHFNCALTSAPIPSSIEFTWHGVLLETWWPRGGCTAVENAGGMYDAFGLTFHYWMPPWGGISLPASGSTPAR